MKERIDFQYLSFDKIDLNDTFFDSLKEDYLEFSDWFNKKKANNEFAYVYFNNSNSIDGFLYLKDEDEELTDIELSTGISSGRERRLKVGTMKINAHGTRLGERFVKKIFDHAIANNHSTAYVTVFDKHKGLIDILVRYGFEKYGTKASSNGTENVYFKFFDKDHLDPLKNYPKITLQNKNYWMLAIWPKFHSHLFPDSLLKTESPDILSDISHTNSIHKIYLSASRALSGARKGDVVVMYRTGEYGKPAEYSAVATSVCVVEEIRDIKTFNNADEFMSYCLSYSIFSEKELTQFWNERKYPYLIRFLYNVALPRRVIRKNIIEEVGISRKTRIVFENLSLEQIMKILELGNINESFIIDKT